MVLTGRNRIPAQKKPLAAPPTPKPKIEWNMDLGLEPLEGGETLIHQVTTPLNGTINPLNGTIEYYTTARTTTTDVPVSAALSEAPTV